MIDLHTHILPRLDDGAKDSKVAEAMLKAEAAQGVTTVVLTPHYYGRKHSPTQFLSRRAESFERIRAVIPGGMSVRLAAEVHFTGLNVPDYEELCKLAIEGTKYILFELPFEEKWSSALIERIADFVFETGYIPVIAHAERYREVRRRPKFVWELIRCGCLIQINAQAFLEKRDRALACALLRHGQVHCLGTDAHDLERRSPNVYAEAQRFLKEKYPVEWEQLQSGMEKLLADERLERTQTKPVKRWLGKFI